MPFGELITAMVTPFDEGGQVDHRQAGLLAEYLVEEDSDAILVSGTTGESPTLSGQEKIELLQTVIDAVAGEVKVIAGTGSYNTGESIKLTEEAEEAGADGIMLVTPYYNKPPQNSLYEHFRVIAEATSLPVMIYNVPCRTSRNIHKDTLVRLAGVDNITAVKEASADLGQITEMAAETPSDFTVYSGDDFMALPVLAVGGSGVVSVASHLVGIRIKEMIRAFKEGRTEEATRINAELFPLFRTMFITTNPIPVKTSLNLIGHRVGPFRLPLTEMEREEKNRLIEVLKNYELL